MLNRRAPDRRSVRDRGSVRDLWPARDRGSGNRLAGAVTSETAAAGELAVRAAALLRGGVTAERVIAVLAEESPTLGATHLRAPGTDDRAPPAHTRPRQGRRKKSRARAAAVTAAIPRVAARVSAGLQIPEALAAEDHPPWRVLAVAWRLAAQSGAPLAPALDRIGGALHALERLSERRAVLLSGPRATVRLVAALPVGTFGLGALLGFDPFAMLFTGPGAVLGLAGVLLLWAGVAWAGALRRRVERADRVDGIEYELLWIATGGGVAPAGARVRVVDAVDSFGASWVPLQRFRDDAPLSRTVVTATATGVALRPLLLEEADGARARSHTAQEQAAERLAVVVLVPLGLCVLPAFIALGVAPVVLAMVGGV